MVKQQSHKSSACKLQSSSELKASITQQTENQKAHDDNLNALCELRQNKPNRLLIGNLNITSICFEFNQTKCLLKRKVDILNITENKLDSSFRTTQFLIDGYSKPFRFGRNRSTVGVLLYVRKDIACRESKSNKFPNDIVGIFNELNLRKAKWLFFQHIIFLLNRRTTIFLMLAIA